MQGIRYNRHYLLHLNHKTSRRAKSKKEPDIERRNRLDSPLFAVTDGASGGGGLAAAHLSRRPSWSALAPPGGGAGVSPDNERSFPLSRDCEGVFFFLLSNFHDLEKTQLESVRAARAACAVERATAPNGRRASRLLAEYLPGAGWKASVRPCRFRFGWHTDL